MTNGTYPRTIPATNIVHTRLGAIPREAQVSLFRPFVGQAPGAIVREAVLLGVIVMLAVLATVVFGGPGPGAPFDLSLDQVPLPF